MRVVEADPGLIIEYNIRPVLIVSAFGPVCQHTAGQWRRRVNMGQQCGLLEWYPAAAKRPLTVQTMTRLQICLISFTLFLDPERKKISPNDSEKGTVFLCNINSTKEINDIVKASCVKIMLLTRSVECEWINKSPLPTNVSDNVNAPPPPYTLDIDDSGGGGGGGGGQFM